MDKEEVITLENNKEYVILDIVIYKEEIKGRKSHKNKKRVKWSLGKEMKYIERARERNL